MHMSDCIVDVPVIVEQSLWIAATSLLLVT